MKTPLALPLCVFTLLASFSVRSATVVTFDDLSETASGSFIANGYQGLDWSNVLALNGILSPNNYPRITNGTYYGVVSPSNVALAYSTAEIDSPNASFNFLGAYLTGRWNSNLNIEVQGFRDTNLVYDQTVVASATNATLFTFNFLDIDQLTFNSSGGQAAFGIPDPTAFVMDNFTFEFIPEPSSFLLAAFGAVSLVAVLRRKRG
jgi:hypothetical protein